MNKHKSHQVRLDFRLTAPMVNAQITGEIIERNS